MTDDIKLPQLPYPYDAPAYRTVGAVIQEYARAAIKADRQQRGEPLSALAALVNALRDRHYGRMPDEVQTAYDRARSIVYASPQPTEPVKAPSDEEILEVMKPCELLTSITRRFYEDEWTEQVIDKTKLLEQSRTLIAKYATTQPPQNPEGYKLVPIEPTEEMLLCGLYLGLHGKKAYLQMLAAAPKFGEEE